MKSRNLPGRTAVCQFCDSFLSRNSSRPGFQPFSNNSRSFSTSDRTFIQKRQTPFRTDGGYPRISESSSRSSNGVKTAAALQTRSQSDIEMDIRDVVDMRNKLISSTSIPTEQEILNILVHCKVTADFLVEPTDQVLGSMDGSAASALLSVEERATTKLIPKAPKSSTVIQKYIDQLSSIANSIVLHPAVFITPSVLRQHVNLQAQLKKPETLPSVFELYASKPVPLEGSHPIKYKKQNPNKVANAVPIDVADNALQAVIETKQLRTAMEIVESTYATKAFRRYKFARKGLIPTTAILGAPFAAYIVASKLSMYQSTVDPAMATNVAFAGILAYLGFTATIGFVAVTTANDQMDRVTWIPGMPLRERWIREEERAAIDKIAGAWGFRETWRRGEEEGEEWNALREWIGRKGMILDQTELMEGME